MAKSIETRATEFAVGAKLYYECALAADRKIGFFPGYEIAAPAPVMSLVAHSIELSLKSFLLASGVANVRSFGHDLQRAFDECQQLGALGKVEFDETDLRVLEIIDDLHQNFVLRYREKSKLGRIPVFGPLQVLSKKCLDLCDAPTLDEIASRQLKF